MNGSMLDELVDLVSYNYDETDDYGQPTEIATDGDLTTVAANIPAHVKEETLRTIDRGGDPAIAYRTIFTIRHRSDIDAANRVVWGGNTFRIVNKRGRYRERFLVLTTEVMDA